MHAFSIFSSDVLFRAFFFALSTFVLPNVNQHRFICFRCVETGVRKPNGEKSQMNASVRQARTGKIRIKFNSIVRFYSFFFHSPFGERVFLHWLRNGFRNSSQSLLLLPFRVLGVCSTVRPAINKPRTPKMNSIFFLFQRLLVFVYIFRNNQGFYSRKHTCYHWRCLRRLLLAGGGGDGADDGAVVSENKFQFSIFCSLARQNVYSDNKTFVKKTHLSSWLPVASRCRHRITVVIRYVLILLPSSSRFPLYLT